MKLDVRLKNKILHCFKRRHCEKLCCERTSQFYICVYIQCRRRHDISSFLFPAETEVLVPVFSQSTDVLSKKSDMKEKVKLVQYISPYMKYLLVFTQHPQVLIAGSVHRCTGSYGGKCVVAREQVISSTTHSLSCHSYAPVNFHKLYPSMSTNWSWDCGLRRDVWVSWSRSVSNDVTSKFFKRGKGSSLLLSFTVFTYWKSSKCKKSLLFYSESYT